MGRKTNSVSLRLKKTNRDYNNCWYGDILYTHCFSKSLKVDNFLAQTFKTIGVPCPRTSVIGAFKKANLLVCYLDPKKRKRLLEKSSKGLAYTLQASQTKQKSTKGNFPLTHGKEGKGSKQDSQALLNPLQAILDNNYSGPSFLQQTIGQQLPANLLDSGDPRSFAGTKLVNHDPSCKTQQEQAKQPFFLDVKPIADKKVLQQKNFILSNVKQQISTQLLTKTKMALNYFFTTSIGLELVESKQFSLNEKSPATDTTVTISSMLRNTKQVNKKTNNFRESKPLVCFSKNNFMTGKGFSLESTYFFNCKQKNNTLNCQSPKQYESLQVKSVDSFKGKSLQESAGFNTLFAENRVGSKNISPYTQLSLAQEGPLFFPSIFEGTLDTVRVCSGFKKFSQGSNSKGLILPLVIAFNKNFQIFSPTPFGRKGRGQKNMGCYALATPWFSYLSEFFLNNPSYIKASTKPFLIEKKQLWKKESGLMFSLYSFYNGFSYFWENPVSISFYKSINETCCALFLADTVSYLLEKRVDFRSIKRQLLLELNYSNSAFSVDNLSKTRQSKHLAPFLNLFENKKKVTGIRISCSGRVGGRSKKAQRSRKDTFMWGETGLHVFSSKLDFAKTHAETPFGVVGVQVWVCTK